MARAVVFRSAALGLLSIAGAVGTAPSTMAQQGMEHGGSAAADGGREHAGRATGRSGGMNMSRVRHRFVRRNGLPAEYRSLENPLAPTRERVDAGERLYRANCAACHGPSGQGDGPAAESLDPAPTNIARLARMPMAGDAYLYWTIAEGGVPVGSAMPPYEDSLDEQQIWQVILYLRRM